MNMAYYLLTEDEAFAHMRDGKIEYRNEDDLLDREDGPAVITYHGVQRWYKNGVMYNEIIPVVFDSDDIRPQVIQIPIPAPLLEEVPLIKNVSITTPAGVQTWYKDGVIHREDGPAIEYPNGAQAWIQNGKLHRLDGPALIPIKDPGSWYRNGKLHRDDGPAIEYADGSSEWYIDGVRQKWITGNNEINVIDKEIARAEYKKSIDPYNNSSASSIDKFFWLQKDMHCVY